MEYILTKLGLMNFLLWLKPTLEGTDGKASFRRISALILMMVFCYGSGIVFLHTYEKPSVDTYNLIFNLLCLIALFFLVVTAIVSAQIITEFVKGRGVNVSADAAKTLEKETEEIIGS